MAVTSSKSQQSLSRAYESDFAALIRSVASAPGIGQPALTMFWPKIGSQYQGDLLVIDRMILGDSLLVMTS